jgi:hypothetical protein
MASAVVLLLVAPLALLVGGMLALAILPQFFGASPTVTRTSFDCPFSKRRVTAEFESRAEAGEPADVRSCSAFPDPRRIGCKKECLELAHTGAVASPMMPRFSLIADGVAYRGTAMTAAPTSGSPPDGQMTQAA